MNPFINFQAQFFFQKNEVRENYGYHQSERYPIPVFFSPSIKVSGPLELSLKNRKIKILRSDADTLSITSQFFWIIVKDDLDNKDELLETTLRVEKHFYSKGKIKLLIEATKVLTEYHLLKKRQRRSYNSSYTNYRSLVIFINSLTNHHFFSLISLVNTFKVPFLLHEFLEMKMSCKKKYFVSATKNFYSDLNYTICQAQNMAAKLLTQPESHKQSLNFFLETSRFHQYKFSIENCFDEKEIFDVLKHGFSINSFDFFVTSILEAQKLKLLDDEDIFIEMYNHLHRFLETLHDLLHVIVRKFEFYQHNKNRKIAIMMINKIKKAFLILSCI